MAKTGDHLKPYPMGDNVLGVQMFGRKENPEPIYFRVRIPCGDVDIVRLDNGEYWVHIRVDHEGDGGDPSRKAGRIVNARLDQVDKASSQADLGDFNRPELYHLAVRVAPVTQLEEEEATDEEEYYIDEN
jgi:hypothetical protein